MRRVVVTGMGVICPIGNSLDEVSDALREGRSGIEFCQDYKDHGFRSHVHGSLKVDLDSLIDRRLRRFMGDGAAYNYLAMEQAIEDSGLPEDQVSNVRTGMVMGSGGTSTQNMMLAGFGAVERSTLEMGDVVAVQGSGPVGLSATAFARLRGAGTVITIGAPQSRLQLAAELGADVVLSIEDTEPAERVERIRELTGGRGADVVIEAAGNPKAVPEGFQLLRDGGTYVIAGHYTDVGSVEINTHLDINLKYANVRGQWGTAFRHVVRALTLLQKYKMPFARVIGARYGLDETNRALADVAALDVTKAIIMPNT